MALARPSGPQKPAGEIAVLAQVRAHAEPVACRAVATAGGLTVTIDGVLSGVAAGQTLVLYDGERVLGSATIDQAA